MTRETTDLGSCEHFSANVPRADGILQTTAWVVFPVGQESPRQLSCIYSEPLSLLQWNPEISWLFQRHMKQLTKSCLWCFIQFINILFQQSQKLANLKWMAHSLYIKLFGSTQRLIHFSTHTAYFQLMMNGHWFQFKNIYSNTYQVSRHCDREMLSAEVCWRKILSKFYLQASHLEHQPHIAKAPRHPLMQKELFSRVPNTQQCLNMLKSPASNNPT